MADILERLQNRRARLANATQGWIKYDRHDDRIDQDAAVEIERLRGIEAKLKKLIGMLGADESTLDLNVPLAFRDLKNRLKQTQKLPEYTPANSKEIETVFNDFLKIAEAK